MLLYLAHKYGGDKANMERVKKIAHDLQMENPTHCVVCPLLNFSFDLMYSSMVKKSPPFLLKA